MNIDLFANIESRRRHDHDNVIKWNHFPRYWPYVRGIHRSPVYSPHKDQWREALMFSLICAWTEGWINNRDAGHLRHYRAHYDVTVMVHATGRYLPGHDPHIVRCRYNAASFLQNRQKQTRLWGRDMGWVLWVQNLIYVLLLSLQCCNIPDRVIAAADCKSLRQIFISFRSTKCGEMFTRANHKNMINHDLRNLNFQKSSWKFFLTARARQSQLWRPRKNN